MSIVRLLHGYLFQIANNNYKVRIFLLNLQKKSVNGSVSLREDLYYFCKSP